jgi:hypothetical protein
MFKNKPTLFVSLFLLLVGLVLIFIDEVSMYDVITTKPAGTIVTYDSATSYRMKIAASVLIIVGFVSASAHAFKK